MVTKSVSLAKITSTILLLGLLGGAGLVALGWYDLWSSEQLGIYRSTTTQADLDGDGDLDVVLGQTRWEGEDASFAGISLWFNQGGGQFAPGDQELPGGFSAAAADVDGDGDADLLILDGYEMTLSLNQGGAQGGKVGVFQTNNSITPSDQHFHYSDRHGLAVEDFNGDGYADIFAGAYTEDYSVWLNQGHGTFQGDDRR